MSKLLMMIGVMVALFGGALYAKGASMKDYLLEYNPDAGLVERVDARDAKATTIRNGMVICGVGFGLLLVGAVLRVGDKATAAKASG